MRTATALASCIVCFGLVGSSAAQFKRDQPEKLKLGESRTSQWRMGLTIQAVGGACRGGVGYMSVPMDWPEQEVKILAEDVSPEIKINFAQIDDGVKVMNIKIGQLSAGQEAQAIVTFEVRRSMILPPENTDGYMPPDPKKIPRAIRPYLGPSPKIESRDPKIRDLAKQICTDKEQAWEQVEAIYDWVRENITYKPSPLKGALAALKNRVADCEDMTSLFIALCRAANIPARTVWVPEHCYPEFYLQDKQGEGRWFPCQIAGSREFGGITELRPIWQKGDNIRPPVNTKERRRYLDFDLTITGSARPEVRPIREAVAK